MPQDGRRLFGYRPFITCGDPNGVVECGTIRRSNKSNLLNIEPSGESRLIRLKSSIHREELGQGSFQLLEVSKGAHKLNHMIKSWSKGITDEGRAKEIAKDLLKGALDLQESLKMLGKLQEASKHVAQLKQKQEKSKYSPPTCDLYQGREIGFQRLEVSPRDECSRKKIEELREAIRPGFVKQKQLQLRKSQSQSEIPSTSSSQSSSVNHDEKIDWSPVTKTKGTNLIAKLMGLEEISSKPIQRKLQDEFFQQKQPDYGIHERPKITKPVPELRDYKPDQRMLEEVVKSMQCEGLIKATTAAIKDIKIVKENEKLPARRIGLLEAPRDSDRRFEKPRQEVVSRVASCDKRESKLAAREVSPRRKERNADREPNKSRHPSHPTTELVKNKKNDTIFGEIGKSTKSSRRSPHKAKSTQISKVPVKTSDPVAVKSVDRLDCSNREASPQRSQYRKPGNAKKEALSCDTKHDHTKKATSPPIVLRSKKTASNQQTRLPSRSAGNQKRTVGNKPPQDEHKEQLTEIPEAKLDKNDDTNQEDDMKIYTTCQNPDQLETSPENGDAQFTGEDPGASESKIPVLETNIFVENSPTALSASTTGLREQTTGQKLDLEGSETGDHIRSLLLSSPSFLSRAEDLFGFIPSSISLLQNSSSAVSMSPDESLLLDYANELIECRIDDRGSANALVINGLGSFRTHSSLHNFLEEIPKEIENLSIYCQLASERNLVDGVFMKMHRDLYSHQGSVLSKIWDAGWTRGFCLQDADHVFKEVEETILCRLIEETLVELML